MKQPNVSESVSRFAEGLMAQKVPVADIARAFKAKAKELEASAPPPAPKAKAKGEDAETTGEADKAKS